MPTLDTRYPAFVRLEYSSAFGPHVQEICTLAWVGLPWEGPGEFTTHSGGLTAADVMIENLVDDLCSLVPPTTVYSTYTIYTLATPISDPVPVFAKTLTQAGTLDPATGQAKAVQWTATYRTTSASQFRIVLLDRPSANVWGNVFTPDAAVNALTAELTDADLGWADRQGGRPAAFYDVSISLNKRLRRRYKMI